MRIRSHTLIGIFFLAGTLLSCGDSGLPTVSADQLREAAVATFPAGDAPPMGRIRAVLFGPGDTVVIVNAEDPFLHLYRRDGSFQAAVGREGEGPGEFRKPYIATLHRDTLYVQDELQMVRWSLNPPGEVDRTGVRIGNVALLSGCSGRLTTVYLGTVRRPDERGFGLRVRGATEWRDLTGLGPLNNRLVLSPANFRPIHWNGAVWLNNYSDPVDGPGGSLERHDCRNGEITSIPLPIPEGWYFTRGTAEVDGRLLVTAARSRVADTTRLLVLQKDSVTAAVNLTADIRIQPGPDSLLALIHYTPIPLVHLVRGRAFLDAIGR